MSHPLTYKIPHHHPTSTSHYQPHQDNHNLPPLKLENLLIFLHISHIKLPQHVKPHTSSPGALSHPPIRNVPHPAHIHTRREHELACFAAPVLLPQGLATFGEIRRDGRWGRVGQLYERWRVLEGGCFENCMSSLSFLKPHRLVSSKLIFPGTRPRHPQEKQPLHLCRWSYRCIHQ